MNHQKKEAVPDCGANEITLFRESIAGNRPLDQARKYPRFPTAGLIDGRSDDGDSGACTISTPVDPAIIASRLYAASTSSSPDSIDNRAPDDSRLESRASIIDFSEDGIQAILESDNLSLDASNAYYLELRNLSVPLILRWNKEVKGITKAGFQFLTRLNNCPDLSLFISELSKDAVNTLMEKFGNGAQFSKEMFTYTFVNILHHLRLHFINELSELNYLLEFADASGIPKDKMRYIKFVKNKFSDKNILLNHAAKTSQSKYIDERLISFLKSCQDHGCYVAADNSYHVMLKNEVLLSLSNCIIWKPCTRISYGMHSSLYWIYDCFRKLFEIFPDEAAENEMGIQFKLYNDLVCHITALRKQLLAAFQQAGD